MSFGPVVQRTERSFPKRDVAGSSPAGATIHPEVERAVRRGRLMSRIRSTGNTSTEKAAVRLLGELGVTGWALHWEPARPADLCFPRLGIAVFLNGCFWHGCPLCYSAPRVEGWREHLMGNRARDVSDYLEMRRRGWRVMVVWECEMKHGRRPLALLRELGHEDSPRGAGSGCFERGTSRRASCR